MHMADWIFIPMLLWIGKKLLAKAAGELRDSVIEIAEGPAKAQALAVEQSLQRAIKEHEHHDDERFTKLEVLIKARAR